MIEANVPKRKNQQIESSGPKYTIAANVYSDNENMKGKAVWDGQVDSKMSLLDNDAPKEEAVAES